MSQESFFYFHAVVGALAALIGIFALRIMAGERMSSRLTYFGFNRNGAEALYAVRGSAATAAKIGMIRVVVGALAALLGVLGLWVTAAELMSPRLVYFPSDRNEAEALYAVRRPAATAAKVGMIRGDLWTVAAITKAAPLLFGATASSPEQASRAAVENMRAIATVAARLSPHDSRIWLVLASLDFRLGGSNRKAAEFLKLSYYTGPNEFSVMPLRLLLAVESEAISDEEVRSLVPLDVQRIVMQRPDLKPAIELAYKNALPKGREVIEATLEKTDPSFLATIKQRHRGSEIPM